MSEKHETQTEAGKGMPMEWFHAAHTALEQDLSDRELPAEQQTARCSAAIDGLHGLFMELVKELRIKDEWPESFCHIVPFGTGVIEKSAKIGVEFTLAITLEGWLIAAGLRHAWHIRHMTDEFWQQITRLTTLGKATLTDGYLPEPTPEAKRLIQHEGSLAFSLARDYVLGMLAPESDARRPSYCVGGIEVRLPLKAKEAQVRQFFRDGTDALYRANYLLYRSAYLEFRRLLKHHGLQGSELAERMKRFSQD